MVSGGLCTGCLGERRRFVEVPGFCELELCAHCGSVRVGRRWVKAGTVEEELASAVRRALVVRGEGGAMVDVEVKVKVINEHSADADVSSRTRFGKESILQRARTRVRVRRAVCERCSKLHGRYYEALLQVRAKDRKMAPQEKEQVRGMVGALSERSGDREDFIAREEEVDGGLDYQLGKLKRGRTIARALAGRLGGKVTESSTLVGNKEGRELFRVTFLLRLPGFRPGDFLGLEGRPLLVTSAGPNGISATDLGSGRSLALDPRSEARARRLGGPESAEEAVVLQARRPELTVLDPVSLAPVLLVAPAWFWEAEPPESVRVFRTGEDLFLVPPLLPSGPAAASGPSPPRA